jgi:hypothetical protein
LNRGLVDLVVLSVRGRLVRRARLLRQPRYLAASLVGAGYLALVLVPRLFRRGPGHGPPRSLVPEEYAGALHLGLGLALAAAVTCAWLLVSSRPALRLNETEIDLLLPAPLPRRQIILYSLLRQQAGLLTSTLVIFFVRGANRWGGGVSGIVGLFGLWAVLTLADLHLKGISLWKARLKELPALAAGLRRGTAAALAAAWWIAVLAALNVSWKVAWKAAGPASLRTDPGAFALALARAVEGGRDGTLLAPFAWMATPLSGTVLPSAAGLLCLLAAVALHAVWVVRSRASFEEATLERARRESARKGISRGERRAQHRATGARHREPFRLAPAGPPETAILWKNLMLRGRTPLSRLTLILAGTTVAATAAVALFGQAASAALTVTGLFLLCGIPPLAGMILRNDLRTDLLYVDVLRTWPIPSRRLVLAELLAPAANVLLILLLGCGLLTAAVIGDTLAPGTERIQVLPPEAFAGAPPLLALPVLLGSALVVGMAVALLSLSLQNLAVLLLPSWVGLGGISSRRGTVVLGQRLLVGIGYLLAMTIAALPTLLALGAVAALHVFLQAPFHLWEVPLLAATAALLLGAEVALLARFAGVVWDRMDPSAEILTLAEDG